MNPIRIGVFGAGRGADLAGNFQRLGCEITAICDFHEERLNNAAKRIGGNAALYRDFDSFIEHDMDAVILANYFHEHAPYAIRCMEKDMAPARPPPVRQTASRDHRIFVLSAS